MALDVSIKTLETLPSDINLGAITVFDNTGVYSTSNPGGWTAPNPVTGDVTKTEIVFTDPDGTETTIEDTELVLPNTTSIGFMVTADMLGLTEITSGVWELEIRYTIAGIVYCKRAFFLMYQVVNCCLEKRVVDYVVSDPTDSANMKTMDLTRLLCVAVKNAQLGQEETARSIMSYLRRNCEC